MKKSVSLLLCLMLAFSSLFVSCDENETGSCICKVTVKSGGGGNVAITNFIGTSANVLLGNMIEVVATPNDGYAFTGWYIDGIDTPVSADAKFAFTVSENVTLTARFEKEANITINSTGNGKASFKDYTATSVTVLYGTEITVIATPYDNNNDFVGWFVDDAEEPVSIDAEYTFTVSESIALTAKFENEGINGHGYVDLGLSVKWATCNVGASTPGDYGDYYAWGETTTKSDYSSSTSTTYGKQMSSIAGNPTYDVARKKWGSPWRLPTKAEFQELIDNCTWEWTTQNGHSGYKVTSKKNGNSIFLPAAGWRYGTSSNYQGALGYFWSASPAESDIGYAYGLGFNEGYRTSDWSVRYGGHSVRPVSQN